MDTSELMLGGGGVLPCSGLSSHPERVEILLAASCYRNQDEIWADGLLGSYTDLTYHTSLEEDTQVGHFALPEPVYNNNNNNCITSSKWLHECQGLF